MRLRHAVLLTPLVSLRLPELCCYKQNEQSNFHSPYTLPSSVSRKSFACHSYENTGGVGAFFPFWNSSGSLTTPILVLSFHTLTNCKILQLLCFDIHTKLPGGYPPSTQRLSESGSSDHVSIYPLSIQALAHSFALKKIPTPFLSIDSALFAKNHPGWGEGGYSTSSTFGRSDFRTFRRVPHFPKSAIFSIP
jgi:hypothetical protein